MDFSVLMSLYYKEKPTYFEESMKSILNQTIVPSEIVIVLDGKLTDQLYHLVNKYKKLYTELIKLIELPDNLGLGKALQVGLEHCTYNIIARMDTDDICMPNRFEKQLHFMSENTDISVLGSWIVEFEDDINNKLSVKKVPLSSLEVEKFAKRRNPINHMTVMFKKEDILKVGGYLPFLWNEDYYLWVRMLNQGFKIANIDDTLVYARAGNEMYKRRGGFSYFLNEINLQNEFRSMGFINNIDRMYNIIVRGTVRLVPNSIRGAIYQNVLRENVKKVSG